MAKNKVTSLRAQWLGERLRKHRVAAGDTLSQVAEHIQLTQGTLSHFEGGTYRIRRAYINELIDFYGVHDKHERDALKQLNEDAWRKDWWDGDTDDLPTEFVDYTWLEARAVTIHVYEPLIVTGLLQTRRYAEAVIQAAHHENTGHDEDRLVELRMARQRTLTGDEPTKLAAVIEEATLLRPIGGRDVQSEQLKHLIEATHRPNICIQIIPTAAGWHAGVKGLITYFEMPDPYPHVAYTEGLTSRLFIEDEAKVAVYRQAYDGLRTAALSEKESVKHMQSLLKELT